MKMLLIVYNISLQEELYGLIDRLGVSCFTQWPRLIGRGMSTGPKMDDNVWPGANSAMMVVTDAEMAEKAMAEIQRLRDEVGMYEGIKAFQLAVEKMTGEI
ncbi:MAG: hypothetical protein GX946_09110 [Oligosphaeraceae bacterium]|nr:hypothetical protein [Oligosphaeraceae bacterium]